MTDVIAVECVDDDVRAALLTTQWQTSREIWERTGRWSHISVKHALREMGEASKVEWRYGGTLDRPVREYRAWK